MQIVWLTVGAVAAVVAKETPAQRHQREAAERKRAEQGQSDERPRARRSLNASVWTPSPKMDWPCWAVPEPRSPLSGTPRPHATGGWAKRLTWISTPMLMRSPRPCAGLAHREGGGAHQEDSRPQPR